MKTSVTILLAATQTGGSIVDAADAAVQSTLRSLGVESYWEKIAPLVTEYGVRVLGALLFLGLAFYVGMKASRAASRALERSGVETTLSRFLGTMLRALILILAVLTCMAIVGIPVTSFAAMLGAGGLAIGLAVQGSLSNVAAGAALSITRPFKVGDLIVIAGQTGVADEIGLFATALNTLDNRRIIIPNSQIFGTIIENITHNPVRRAEVDVGIAYGADLSATRLALERAAHAVRERVADPPPLVMITGFADSSVSWKVCIWVRRESFLQGRQELFHSVKHELDAAGIEIPFPQRVVRLVADAAPVAASARQARASLPTLGTHAGVKEMQEDDMVGGAGDAAH